MLTAAPEAAGAPHLRPRRARCTACGTIFEATPVPAATAAPAREDGGGEDGTEEESRRRSWLLPAAMIAVSITLIASVLLRPDWVEQASGYRPPAVALPAMEWPAIRLPRIELPRIELPRIELPRAEASPLLVEARMNRRPLAGGRSAVEVAGTIRNPTATVLAVPPVELLLLDRAGRIVGRWSARAGARHLAPGETARFESSNVDPPPTATMVRARLKPAELGRP